MEALNQKPDNDTQKEAEPKEQSVQKYPSSTPSTTPVLKEFTTNVYIVEGLTVDFFGFPYPTRSVIVRVEGHGDSNTNDEREKEGISHYEAWMWSPIQYTRELADEIEHTIGGPIKYLVSPNKLHHLFLSEWALHHEDAIVYLSPGLRQRKVLEGKLPLDDVGRVVDLIQEEHGNKLSCAQPPKSSKSKWPQTEISFVNFSGSFMMNEIVFFHHPSKTILVCDLIQRHTPKTNPVIFSDEKWWKCQLMKLDGIYGLEGSTPREWRISFPFWTRNATIRRARSVVVEEWKPDQLIVAHGENAKKNATEIVREAFNWM